MPRSPPSTCAATPELLARIRAALRRGPVAIGTELDGATHTYAAGPVTIDLERRLATVEGRPIELTRTQFNLLAYLVRHPNRVLTHRAIAHAVWGSDADVDPANMRVVISQIRRRIEPGPEAPRLIRTIIGIRYSFDA